MKFPKPWYRKSRRAWFLTLDGQQIKLGTTKKVALARYQDLMAKPEKRVVPSGSLLAIIDAFLEWCQKHRAPKTYEWYRFRLQLLAQKHPHLRAVDLRPFHIQQWIDSYTHLSNGSKRNYCRAIQRAMRWAEEQGLIDRTPLAHFKKPRAGRRETVISPEEYQEILACVPDENFRDLLTFAWETGARAAECLAIEKRHVDMKNGRIIFPPTEEKMGRAPRIIYLSDRAREIIRRLLMRTHNRLFVNSAGVPWNSRSVNCGFLRIQMRMGKKAMQTKGITITPDAIAALIPKLCPSQLVKGQKITKTQTQLIGEARRKLENRMAAQHAKKYCLTAFRHSWCHHALCRGIDALTVSVLMGHADPTMVAKVYSHLGHAPQYLADQAKKAVV